MKRVRVRGGEEDQVALDLKFRHNIKMERAFDTTEEALVSFRE